MKHILIILFFLSVKCGAQTLSQSRDSFKLYRSQASVWIDSVEMFRKSKGPMYTYFSRKRAEALKKESYWEWKYLNATKKD